MLFVRISFPWDRIKTALEKVSEQSTAMVVYEHNDKVDNVHVHCLVVDPKISTDTMKNYIRKEVGKVEKTQWSFKKADDYSCITYMSKGKLEPVHCANVPVDEISRLKALWVSKERSVVRKNDKPTQYDLALEIHRTLHEGREKQTIPDYFESDENYTQHYTNALHDYKEYCQLAIKLHHKHHISFSFFSLDKVIHTAYTMRQEHRESFVAKLTEKFFGAR